MNLQNIIDRIDQMIKEYNPTEMLAIRDDLDRINKGLVAHYDNNGMHTTDPEKIMSSLYRRIDN